MKHFTKFLLLCLAICVVPNLAKSQNMITVMPGGTPAVCDGFDDVVVSLPNVSTCELDLATILAAIPNADDVAVAPQPAECTSADFMVEVSFEDNILQTHSVTGGVASGPMTGSGMMFPAGMYNITYTGTNCTGISDDCMLALTVEPDPDQVLDVLACNNSINASLTEDCMVEVTTDMMLEGNSPCETGYTFEIENAATGEILDGTTITSHGTYNVTVFDAAGTNSCWGTVIAEDYLPPVICCFGVDPVTGDCLAGPTRLFTCTDDLTPGAGLESGSNEAMNELPANSTWTNSDNPTAADSVVCVTFTAPGGMNSSIADLSLSLNITHTNITDLKAVLISPSTAMNVGGDTINIFTTPLGSASNINCERDDIIATFADDGVFDHSLLDLDPTCRLAIAPSVLGSFQPEQSFSSFDGYPAIGDYTLCITDCNPAADAGRINSAELFIRFDTGDTIPFPTLGDYTLDPASGDNCYTIDGHPDGDCGPVRACYTDEIVDACDINNGIFQNVERTWTVWDASGNMAQEECTFQIQGSDISGATLESTGLMNFDGLGGNPYFTCQDIFEMDENGNPSPSVTGRPRDISSDNMEFCGNIEMTYTDTRIDICTGSYKVIREWLLVDWCDNGQPVTFNQIIKVEDSRPPITTCSIVDCFEVPVSNPFTCTTSFDVPAPIVLNECGGYTWTISYLAAADVPGFTGDPLDRSECVQPDNELTAGLFKESGIIRTDSDSTPITINDLPLGQVWIRYIVVDDCGNSSPSGAGACEIRVIDDTEPTAVCDEHTTVTLGNTCEAQINAQTFDDLSFDSCGDIVLYEARRDSDSFGPAVRFGKSDLNNPVPITLRVTDSSGHTNTCEGEVIVRDNIQPVFTSTPQDVTISCDFTDAELQASLSPPTAADNCPDCYRIEMNMGDPNQDECGDGSIRVTWDLFDTNQLDSDGNPLKVNSISQQISFENSSPFTVTPSDWPSDRLDLTGCGPDIDPSVTGEPNLSLDDACALTAVSHEDLEFFDLDDACMKILREWTVIDFCQYDESVSSTVGIWHHTQVLIINNTEAPTLVNGSDRQFCADETCSGAISIDLVATDDCTPIEEIEWTYSIDFQSDGTIDDQATGIKVDSVLNLAGTYEVGVHKVTVILRDNCGNISDPYMFDITVTDCVEPTPICLPTASIVVLPSSGEVEIWASDFELHSDDQCGGELNFSFSPNPDDRNKTFTCADLRDGVRTLIPLEVWVHDNAGNMDFCSVSVDLQDNGTGEGACPDTLAPSAAISGFIFTEQNEMVNNVAVQVTSAQPEFPLNFTTSQRGDYTFNNLLTGHNYDLSSAKNDDHINGVSTLDIVLIQKHILGLTLLDSPYKIIAADTDNNEFVSAADLVTLRKLVLGIIEEFPNGQESWRFVDEDFTFGNQFNPFPYDEEVIVNNLGFNETNMNFMAVKIGDVNGNVNPSSYSSHITEVRSNNVIEFKMEDKLAAVGEIISIPVTANNFDEIIGFQFTMDFDQSAMEYAGIASSSLEMSEANLGLVSADRGLISVSWNDVEANSFDADEVLFTLEFKAKADTRVSEVFALNSRITNAEAYSNDLSLVNTKLVFKDGASSTFEVAQFELYQNNPNPFNNETSISFNLAEAGEAVLSVYDVTGKMLIRIVEDYQKGYNEVSLNTSDLSHMQGVMYYTLESKGYTSTKKMVGVR